MFKDKHFDDRKNFFCDSSVKNQKELILSSHKATSS